MPKGLKASCCSLLLPLAHIPGSQIATIIAVYADWGFAAIKGIGWGWAGVIWLYNIVFYLPLDVIKFLIRYAMSGRAWDLVLDQRVRTRISYVQHSCQVVCTHVFLHGRPIQIAFTRKKDFGREERELKWATAQRTLHGLQPAESATFHGMNSYSELNQLADEARRRAEIARYNSEKIYHHVLQLSTGIYIWCNP